MQQQIQNKPLTPLEKLIFDKEQIRRQCVVQEQKLNDDFSYIQDDQPVTPMGFSDYLSIAQGLLPVAWDVARPFLLTWGIRKAQSWFTNLLFKKKK